MKNAIISLSLGDRPFLKYTFASIKEYADKIGVDFHTVTDYDIDEKYKNIHVGRNGNLSYIIKLLVIRDYLKKYDRILFLDDTCVVNSDCPDLFKIVPSDFIGAHNEGVLEWISAAKSTINLFNASGFKNNFLTKHDYINTGVILLPKKYINIFSEDFIIKHGNLGYFNNNWPQQTYLNYIFILNKLPVFYLPYHFNKMTVHEYNNEIINYTNYTNEQLYKLTQYKDFEFLTKENIKPGNINHAFIWHITSFWKPEARYKLIKKLYEISR